MERLACSNNSLGTTGSILGCAFRLIFTTHLTIAESAPPYNPPQGG
jgi:hypothetical protein